MQVSAQAPAPPDTRLFPRCVRGSLRGSPVGVRLGVRRGSSTPAHIFAFLTPGVCGDGSRTERRKGRAWESEGIRSEMLVLWTEGTRWPASRHSLSTELLTQALVPTLPRAGPEGCPDPLGTHWPRPPGPASWPRPASLICWNYVPSGSSVPILSPWGPGTSLESCSVPPLLNTCLKGRNYA